MPYTPTEWECGDTITAAKMNKIEQGIADASSGGALIIRYDHTQTSRLYFDKTWQEVNDAFLSGQTVLVENYLSAGNYGMVVGSISNGGEYGLTYFFNDSVSNLMADYASEYLYSV